MTAQKVQAIGVGFTQLLMFFFFKLYRKYHTPPTEGTEISWVMGGRGIL